mmetsp:Transcript_5886/g.20794  ORF Transcript_5886/g.20794 Transcript_5886/m.20794 type:complete len:208 (+) Transcript_5886:132-755(+)
MRRQRFFVVRPVAVLEPLVPLDGLGQPLAPFHLRPPPEILQLGVVDGIAKIVDVTIVHVLNQLSLRSSWAETQLADELVSELDHGDLKRGSDVVGMEGFSTVEDDVEGANNVVDVDVAPASLALAVDAALLASEQTQDELGDDFLRVLGGAVHVVSSRDDDGELVGLHVCLGDELSSSLGARVRVRGFQHGVLLHSVSQNVSVDLVR